MRRWVLAITLLGSALPPPAEAASRDGFREVKRTDRVTYFAAKGSRIDVKRTEAFLDRLATLFGTTPKGWRLEYYRHRSAGIVHPELGAMAYGITDLDHLRIDSVHDYHPHELVHAAAARFGRPPLIVAEGLAVALTSGGRWRGGDLDEHALRAIEAGGGVEPFVARFTEQVPDAAYAVAGSLVSHLLDRFGIEPLLEFMQGCGAVGGRFETPFRRAFGLSFARATIDWERGLRNEPRAGRAWHDPATWPSSLRRAPRAALVADAAAPPERELRPDETRPVAGSGRRALEASAQVPSRSTPDPTSPAPGE